jgi:hypothetical protein
MWSMGWEGNGLRRVLVIYEFTDNSNALNRLRGRKMTLAQWQQLLVVYAGDTTIPMLGTYRLRNRVLQFEPQFPLEPGVQYRAVFYYSRLPGSQKAENPPLEHIVQLPKQDAEPTTVVRQIYPSADVVPENLLKFYLHFSAPMQRGNIYDYISLHDRSGKKVELPFLEIDEELWDPTMTRLTLFIDPGRIKRGVLPLEEIGPSLEAGKSYTLVINPAWKDANGNPLQKEFQKAFQVAPPDREPPDPARWKIQAPRSGTREPLTIDFPEPMDHALASRVISVVDKSGKRIPGSIILAAQEQRWQLVPDAMWEPGNYALVIQTTLEDLAGNNIGKPFEVDLFEGIERHLRMPTVRVVFEIQ